MGVGPASSIDPATSIGIRLSSSLIGCRTSVSGTATSTAFGDMSANVWVQIDVIRTGASSFQFYRNGALVSTHTTNIPSTQQMNFGFWLTNNSNGTQDIDYMGCVTNIPQRW